MENYNLFETIPGQDYSRVDVRCLEHDGCSVDVGCLYWDWCNFFIDKKRVIGIDPFETQKEGAELFKGVIGTFDGTMLMENTGIGATMINQNSGEQVVVKKWKTFIKEHNIEKISVLKINIEGAEYDLLNSLDDTDFKNIDQIAISFHDWLVPEWFQKTVDSIQLLLSHNYHMIKTNHPWGWVLFIKK